MGVATVHGHGSHRLAAGGPSLHALDAVHVASALRLAPEIEAFVTYDDRQADAARAAGLDVVAPTP